MQSHQSSALAHFLARTREYKAECATLLRTIQEQQNAAAGQQHHHQNAVAANLPRQSAVAELKLSDLSAAECISTTTTTTPTSASIIAGYKDVAGVEHEVEDDDDENATLDGTEAEHRQQHVDVYEAQLVAAELAGLLPLLFKLRQKFTDTPNFDDPLHEALKFLTRKQLAHRCQLVNRRMRVSIGARPEEQLPKFRFGRLILSTDDDLKKSTKYWMLKNRTELKAPAVELAPIIARLENMKIPMEVNGKNLIVAAAEHNVVQLVAHHTNVQRETTTTTVEDDDNAQQQQQAKFLYLIINTGAEDTEDDGDEDQKLEVMRAGGKIGGEEEEERRQNAGRFFIMLPNRLNTLHAMAAAIYWCRQLSKVHFETVTFEQYRWHKSFPEFLRTFGIDKFLPLSAGCFRTYYALTMGFLQWHIRAASMTIWDIPASTGFLHYLLGDFDRADPSAPHHTDSADERSGGRHLPESIRVWGFVPNTFVPPFEDNSSFFDALIQCAKRRRHPKQIVRRIDLNFKQDPCRWPRVLPGMQIIYKCQTFKLDEADGSVLQDTLDVRYRMHSAQVPGQQFEVRVECRPEMFEQEMYAFTLYRDEDGEEEKSDY